jgi:hypothetical protein
MSNFLAYMLSMRVKRIYFYTVNFTLDAEHITWISKTALTAVLVNI